METWQSIILHFLRIWWYGQFIGRLAYICGSALLFDKSFLDDIQCRTSYQHAFCSKMVNFNTAFLNFPVQTKIFLLHYLLIWKSWTSSKMFNSPVLNLVCDLMWGWSKIMWKLHQILFLGAAFELTFCKIPSSYTLCYISCQLFAFRALLIFRLMLQLHTFSFSVFCACLGYNILCTCHIFYF